MIKEIIIKKLFDEIFSISKKRGLRFLKNNLEFNLFLKELAISFPPEDTYSSIYIRTLLIINDNLEYNQFIPLLKLEEVFESFKKADRNLDREIFSRELNTQLHINSKLHSLKIFDAIPSLLVSEFFLTFNDCRKDTWSPNDVYFNSRFDGIDSKSESDKNEIIDKLTNEIRGIQSFRNDEKVVFPEWINKFIKEKINQTFEDIKKGNIDSGLKELYSLKDEIWSDIDVELRNSITKKIAFCYLEKRDLRTSISFYEEAKKIKKDAGTLSVLALLYHKKKNEDEFDKTLRELDEVDSKKANLTRIRFGTSSINPDDYYKAARSNELQDEETLLSLSQYYSEINENKKAFYIGCKLVEHLNKIEYKEFTAEFGVLYLQTQGIHMGVNYLNTTDREILVKGTEYIRDCFDFYKGTEILKYKTYLSNYRAIYEMWNDNYDVAIETLNHILACEPNNYQFIKSLGAVYAKKKKYLKVIEIYNAIPDNVGLDDLPLLKSVSYFVLDDIEKAKNTLIDGLKWIVDPDIRERTLEQLVNFYFFSDDVDGAEKIYKENINSFNSQNKRIIQAKLLRYHGEISEAKDILIELKNELIGSMIFSPLLPDIGGELERIGEVNQTIELYERFANYEKDTFFVKSLYDLYVKTGKLSKAVEICENQRKSGIHEFYTRNEIAIFFNYKDYDKVIELAKSYIAKFPNKIEIRLHLIYSLLKKGNKTQAKDYLKYPFDIKTLDKDNAGKLIGHYLNFNLNEDAFETAYKLLAYFNDSTFHDLYIVLCSQKDNYMSSIKPELAVIDATIIISENGNLKILTFVDREIEEYLEIYYNEILINHNKYHRLFGKSAGYKEMFIYEGEDIEIEIKEIKHRYTFAFHKALKECGNFKSESAIKIFDTSLLEKGKLPEIIEQNLEASEQSQLNLDKAIKLYEAGNIPLVAVSTAFGYEFIDLWDFCTLSSTHFIRSSTGNFEEVKHIVDYLMTTTKKELLFDLTSLLLLYKLNSIETLKYHFSIYVLQDLLDYLENYIAIKKINSDGDSHRMFRANGKNYFIKQSSEQIKSEILELESMKNWVNANFEIYPPDILLELDKSEIEKYTEYFGDISCKSYLLAQNTDVLLVCDDYALRQLFKSESLKPVFWIQSLFFYLEAINELGEHIYNDISRKLVELNISYTHINSNVIFDHFSLTNFCINNMSHKFFNILRGGVTDNSAFVVGIDFLRKMWEQNDLDISKKRRITFEVLLALFINRYSWDVSLKIKAITNEMFKEDSHWYEIQNQLKELRKFITIPN